MAPAGMVATTAVAPTAAQRAVAVEVIKKVENNKFAELVQRTRGSRGGGGDDGGRAYRSSVGGGGEGHSKY